MFSVDRVGAIEFGEEELSSQVRKDCLTVVVRNKICGCYV